MRILPRLRRIELLFVCFLCQEGLIFYDCDDRIRFHFDRPYTRELIAQCIHTNIKGQRVVDPILVGLEAERNKLSSAAISNFTCYNDTALIQFNAQSTHDKKAHAICA
jgi:hypothetical protein